MVRVTDIGKAVSYIIGGGVVSVIIEALTHLFPLYIFLNYYCGHLYANSICKRD